LVEQAARALNLPFGNISVGMQTSKADFLGYMNANGIYVETAFRRIFENGGIFLIDEIDAGNPNVLVILNSALSGGTYAFPDKMVAPHKDFVLVATANTFGNGANRDYVGRTKLDAATLDRFNTIEMDYDEDLEYSMIEHYTHAEKWMGVIRSLRALINRQAMRVIISPRATVQGAELLEAGMDFEKVLQSRILAQAPEDVKTSLRHAARSAWGY
jgi:cobaltochelatase CobS